MWHKGECIVPVGLLCHLSPNWNTTDKAEMQKFTQQNNICGWNTDRIVTYDNFMYSSSSSYLPMWRYLKSNLLIYETHAGMTVVIRLLFIRGPWQNVCHPGTYHQWRGRNVTLSAFCNSPNNSSPFRSLHYSVPAVLSFFAGSRTHKTRGSLCLCRHQLISASPRAEWGARREKDKERKKQPDRQRKKRAKSSS